MGGGDFEKPPVRIVYFWKCKKENCVQKTEILYFGMSKGTFKNQYSEHLLSLKN